MVYGQKYVFSTLDTTYILFNFMITDAKQYLVSKPTKHTSEAKKHTSVRCLVSYFNDIKTKSYIKHKKAKKIENTNKVSYPQTGVSISSQKGIFRTNM
jgi:hypothetical protein